MTAGTEFDLMDDIRLSAQSFLSPDVDFNIISAVIADVFNASFRSDKGVIAFAVGRIHALFI